MAWNYIFRFWTLIATRLIFLLQLGASYWGVTPWPFRSFFRLYALKLKAQGKHNAALGKMLNTLIVAIRYLIEITKVTMRHKK